MKPVIVGLAAVIILALVLVARDLSTRGKRRRMFAADAAGEVAAEQRPIPGLAELAAARGWRGPTTEPGFQSAEPLECIGNLALNLHAALNPDGRIRTRTRHLFLTENPGSPAYCPSGTHPRLASCYSGEAGGHPFIVGNVFVTLPVAAQAYGGPLPDGDYLGAAFCAVSMPGPWPMLRILPAIPGLLSGRRGATGVPEFDARYHINTVDRRQVTPLVADRLAGFMASREGFAMTLVVGILICATLQPLSSGADASRLTSDSTQVAALLAGGRREGTG